MVKVLIVDDNENNRLTLDLLLEEIEGLEVYEAEDGRVAIEMCAKQNFDLIFMDIMMPYVDGFEATRCIKQMQKNCMVIALSALDDQSSKNKMLSLGAEDYLTKPIDANLFNIRIKQYIRIIGLRSQETTVATRVLNPFDPKVYSRNITFRIDKEEALVEFWDYWLMGEKNIIDLSDCVRLIYGFGLWLLKNEQSFSIVIEESKEKIYMMLLHQGAIRSHIIRNLLLKHFAQAKYILTKEMLSFQLDYEAQKSNLEVSDEAKKILSKTHYNTVSAAEYLASTPISFMNKIDGLEIINDKTDQAILDFEHAPSQQTAMNICDNFQEYANILAELMEFSHLGFALQTLIKFLSALDEEQLVEMKVKKLSSMLLNLLRDLASWRENVFITQVARDIHYLDASLLSSCIQIEAIFEEKSVEMDEDNEIEFF